MPALPVGVNRREHRARYRPIMERSSARRRVAAALRWVPDRVTQVRRSPPPPRVTRLLLAALAVVLTVVSSLDFAAVGASVLALPLLGAGLLLERRDARAVAAVVLVCFLYDVLAFGVGRGGVGLGAPVVLAVTAGVAYEFSRFREDTGLSGASGQDVLVELRQRLQVQGELPSLPRPWAAQSVVRPAGGGPFAGDFVVSALTHGGRCLEVALVDVSGKGVAAGTRALLLSGALGGLLGSVPTRQFLAAANAYLERQDWIDGFATAVHLALDLTDGRVEVASAGHPPAAVFDAGTGRWSLLDAEGPALGLLWGATYEPATTRLEPGDALLLYTDGLVEERGRDLALGIDRLLGEAERLVPHGFAGLASLLERSHDASDDRGLVLVRHAG